MSDHEEKYRVKWTSRFKKEFKLAKKRGCNIDQLKEVVHLIALGDTCKYIRRMEKRLEEKTHDCEYLSLIYEHGTHFVFPESMLKIMFPLFGDLISRVFKAGREHPKECRAVRVDIDSKLRTAISEW